MKCLGCQNEFEQRHKLQKHCSIKCRRKHGQLNQRVMRRNPFRTSGQSAFEPTDLSSFYESEAERRSKRKTMNER